MNSERYRRTLLAIVAVALCAALFVAVGRAHRESQARRVEIAMDYTDFAALASALGYDREQFLIALRRAGLTSLAVSEELGSAIDASSHAYAISGQALLDQARLAPLADPTLAALARTGGLRRDDVYLIVNGPSELARYRTALAEHFSAHAVSIVRVASPAILAVHTQIDYFNSLGFGFPTPTLALARRTGLLLEPRFQNDDRYSGADIDRMLGQFAGRQKASTVIFFGARNDVLGYPDHLDDTAAALVKNGLAFGSVEAYDKNQIQRGTEGLARLMPAQTTRVQAIAKAEQDKLRFATVVARYLLGARERNVRVVYLRPWLHPEGALSVEAANVELVREIASGLRASGFRLGRATPVQEPPQPLALIVVVALAVPAAVLLLFELAGIDVRRYALASFVVTVAFVVVAAVAHHPLVARKALALVGGISFATLATVVTAPSFLRKSPATLRGSILTGLRTLAVAALVALGGALIVVGLLSLPIFMEEIERFTGVKAVILVPPLVALALYFGTGIFGQEPRGLRSLLREPVRVYQLALVAILALAAILYVARSGNDSEIAPTGFELALRSDLSAVLGVRPRFKEFLVGFPALMLLPTLPLSFRRAFGWLPLLAVAIGTSDIVDTFSHLHTPLVVSLIRVVNGAVVGVLVGIVAIAVVRALRARFAARSAIG